MKILGSLAAATLFIVPLFSSASAEPSIDLRSEMTVVKHQGHRGTCNTFAAVALMEFLIAQKTGTQLDLSEQYSYWVAKHVAPYNDYLRDLYREIDGTAGMLAVEGLKHGVALEAVWPYELTNAAQRKEPGCVDVKGDALLNCLTGTPPTTLQKLPYRANPVYIERSQIAAHLLTEKTPVAINLNWFYKAVDKSGDLRLPTEAEAKACKKGDPKTCGGHVVLLVGYDAATQRFIFRNSWGPAWGQQGYGTIPEEYILKHCETCAYEKDLPTFDGDTREFLEKTLKGVSAQLVE